MKTGEEALQELVTSGGAHLRPEEIQAARLHLNEIKVELQELRKVYEESLGGYNDIVTDVAKDVLAWQGKWNKSTKSRIHDTILRRMLIKAPKKKEKQ